MVLYLNLLTLRGPLDREIKFKGIKIGKNELKLTAFADNASYFMKDKISAEHLLHKIELFSKTSGLEVNKSKSEYLLLSLKWM
jgi:hypothetical protein